LAFKNFVQPIADKLTKDFEQFGPIVQLSKKLKVEPGHLVLGFFGLFFVLIIAGVGSSLLTGVMGFLYPAYMSFKALETDGDDDDKQWLTYWVVFVFVDFLDDILGMVLSMIPLYHLFKMVFYIYLFYPKTKGALKIYHLLIRPLLKKYEGDVDSLLKKGEDAKNKIEEEVNKKIN